MRHWWWLNRCCCLVVVRWDELGFCECLRVPFLTTTAHSFLPINCDQNRKQERAGYVKLDDMLLAWVLAWSWQEAHMHGFREMTFAYLLIVGGLFELEMSGTAVVLPLISLLFCCGKFPGKDCTEGSWLFYHNVVIEIGGILWPKQTDFRVASQHLDNLAHAGEKQHTLVTLHPSVLAVPLNISQLQSLELTCSMAGDSWLARMRLWCWPLGMLIEWTVCKSQDARPLH